MKKLESWLWPNRTIGKKESAVLREEHNQAINHIVDLTELLNECSTYLEGCEPTCKRYELMERIKQLNGG